MRYPEDFDSIGIGSRADLSEYSDLERAALCLHRLEAEVNNGGSHQFFFNSSGELVPQTLEALERIGAPQTKRLLEQAVAIAFPNGYPSRAEDVAEGLAEYDVVGDQLEPPDEAFFAHAEPLSDLMNQCLARGA